MYPNLVNEGPQRRPQPTDPNDFTSRDLSSHLGSVASKGAGGLNIQFFYRRVQIKSRNASTNGTFETRLCVAKQPKGDRYTVACHVISEKEAQRQFPQEFAYFKEYQDTPTSGTPLSELPGVSQSQIMMLVINGVRSIEDLAAMDDTIVNQLGLDCSTAYRIAKKWMNTKSEHGDEINMARQLSAATIENDTLRQRAEAMERAMRDLQAKVDAMQSVSSQGQGAPAGGYVAPSSGVMEVGEVEPMPDTEFGAGDMATGNDDLGMDIDPLKD